MTSPNPEQSGPPLRALAMVLISLAILFAAIGALSLSGSGSDDAAAEPAAETAAETTGAPAAAAPNAQAPAAATSVPSTTSGSATSGSAGSGSATSGAPEDVQVRVLNNSNVSGLAAGTASSLTAEGWTVAETGNFSEAQFAQTAVYYGETAGEEEAARTIAQQLGIPAEPKPTSLESAGSGLIVIVTQ